MTSLISEISEQVGSILTQLGNQVPSPMLRKKNQIKTIHSSLAIENNTLSLRQVKTHLNNLKQAGLIVRVGSNKTGYWKVTIE